MVRQFLVRHPGSVYFGAAKKEKPPKDDDPNRFQEFDFPGSEPYVPPAPLPSRKHEEEDLKQKALDRNDWVKVFSKERKEQEEEGAAAKQQQQKPKPSRRRRNRRRKQPDSLATVNLDFASDVLEKKNSSEEYSKKTADLGVNVSLARKGAKKGKSDAGSPLPCEQQDVVDLMLASGSRQKETAGVATMPDAASNGKESGGSLVTQDSNNFLHSSILTRVKKNDGVRVDAVSVPLSEPKSCEMKNPDVVELPFASEDGASTIDGKVDSLSPTDLLRKLESDVKRQADLIVAEQARREAAEEHVQALLKEKSKFKQELNKATKFIDAKWTEEREAHRQEKADADKMYKREKASWEEERKCIGEEVSAWQTKFDEQKRMMSEQMAVWKERFIEMKEKHETVISENKERHRSQTAMEKEHGMVLQQMKALAREKANLEAELRKAEKDAQLEHDRSQSRLLETGGLDRQLSAAAREVTKLEGDLKATAKRLKEEQSRHKEDVKSLNNIQGTMMNLKKAAKAAPKSALSDLILGKEQSRKRKSFTSETKGKTHGKRFQRTSL